MMLRLCCACDAALVFDAAVSVYTEWGGGGGDGGLGGEEAGAWPQATSCDSAPAPSAMDSDGARWPCRPSAVHAPPLRRGNWPGLVGGWVLRAGEGRELVGDRQAVDARLAWEGRG